MQQEDLRFSDIEFVGERELGSGYISKVRLARHRRNYRLFAVKIVDLED